MMHFLFTSAVTVAFLALSTVEGFRFPTYELDKPVKIVSKTGSLLSAALHVNLMEQEPFKKPDFCHGLDCPEFKVINKTENYELREYAASRWVTTEKMNMKYDDASGVMFMRLFEYIEGNNVKKEKIDMTAPVITRVIPGPGPACKSDFIMSFFIAPKVDEAPAPSSKDVYLSKLPKQRVYVSHFDGRAHEKDWVDHAEKLAKDLQKDKKSFDSSHFYTAGYDSPFRLLFRHNEIWFVAKE